MLILFLAKKVILGLIIIFVLRLFALFLKIIIFALVLAIRLGLNSVLFFIVWIGRVDGFIMKMLLRLCSRFNAVSWNGSLVWDFESSCFGYWAGNQSLFCGFYWAGWNESMKSDSWDWKKR